SVAREGIRVVRDNLYLLIFWIVPLAATIAGNIFLEPHITIRIGIICISTFFTACFIHALNHLLEHRTRSIVQVTYSSLKRIHFILAWGLLSAAFYELINTDTPDSSWIIFIGRWILFLAWPITTFYVLPIIATEHQPITRIAQLTVYLLKSTIFEVIGGSLYCGLILIPAGLLNVLTIALLYYQYPMAAQVCALVAICFIYVLNITYAAFKTAMFYEEYKKPLTDVDAWRMPMA
ncbi:MAG: hypothetical protein ACHQVS_04375, partial [Candidatus Babeliales bacterium]